VLRTSVLVVAMLIGCAAHAQVSNDPEAAAPVAYDTPLTVQDCDANAAYGSGDPCVASNAPDADYDIQYTPDYYAEPVYDEPNVYLGLSVLPPYWGYGYGYGYAYGWPYYGYGYGWPYYGYAGIYWGGYWGGWYGHDHHHDHGDWGHHGGDHGGWDHHGGDHGGHGHDGGGYGHHGDYAHGGNHGGGGHDGGYGQGHGNGQQGDYHGPYRYLGNGRYADQGGTQGHQSFAARQAGAGSRPVNVAMANGFAPSSTPATGRSYRMQNSAEFTGANRARSGASYGGRAALASSSYYAATRSGATMPHDASQSYRATSMPNAGYAQRRGIDSSTYSPRNYASRSAYASQQQYAQGRGGNDNATRPSYARQGGSSYAHNGPAYGGRGAVAHNGAPTYSLRAGNGSPARGGQSYAGHPGGYARGPAYAGHPGGGYAQHGGPAYGGRAGGGGSAPHMSSGGGGAHAGSGGHAGSSAGHASHQH